MNDNETIQRATWHVMFQQRMHTKEQNTKHTIFENRWFLCSVLSACWSLLWIVNRMSAKRTKTFNDSVSEEVPSSAPLNQLVFRMCGEHKVSKLLKNKTHLIQFYIYCSFWILFEFITVLFVKFSNNIFLRFLECFLSKHFLVLIQIISR